MLVKKTVTIEKVKHAHRFTHHDTGRELERRPVFMPRGSWNELQRLCHHHDTSMSLLLERLVLVAAKVHKRIDE